MYHSIWVKYDLFPIPKETKKSIFLEVREKFQGKRSHSSPSPQMSKGRFSGKMIHESSLIQNVCLASHRMNEHKASMTSLFIVKLVNVRKYDDGISCE